MYVSIVYLPVLNFNHPSRAYYQYEAYRVHVWKFGIFIEKNCQKCSYNFKLDSYRNAREIFLQWLSEQYAEGKQA